MPTLHIWDGLTMESNESITNESKTISISDLKSFTIRGLFGYKDIVLPLDKEVLILISENGAGKTNILNILYQVFDQNIDIIESLNCDSISIEFNENRKYEVDFSQINDKDKETEIIKVLNQIIKVLMETHELYHNKRITSTEEEEKENFKINTNISNLKEIKKIDFNFLYFPTYRRIEEDLSNLGYENVELKDNTSPLIQFGMEDVKNKFKQIQTEIKNTAFELFSRVTGEMLTQFIEGLNVTPEMRESIDIEILNLILSRVGEQNISKIEKEKIKKLVSSGKINDPQYDDLVYFLSKLINLYENQGKIDETIKSFVNVCNKYLKPNTTYSGHSLINNPSEKEDDETSIILG